MKAKIKATDQIIDVNASGISNRTHTSLYKETEWSDDYYRESDLDFINVIDWEERRFIVAKDILAAIESNSHPQMFRGDVSEQVKMAIRFADELIKQLKEK